MFVIMLHETVVSVLPGTLLLALKKLLYNEKLPYGENRRKELSSTKNHGSLEASVFPFELQVRPQPWLRSAL